MMIIVFNKKVPLGDLYCLVMVLLSITRNISEKALIISDLINIIMGTILFIILLLSQKKIVPFLLSFGSFLLAILNYLLIGQIGIRNILLTSITYFSLALYFIVSKYHNKIIWISLLVLTELLLLFRLMTSVDNYTVFYNMGRNYVSVYLFELIFIITVCFSKENKQVPLSCFFFVFAGCLFSVGRMGIVTSLLLLFFAILSDYDFRDKTVFKYMKTGVICLCLFFAVSVLVLYSEKVIQVVFSRFVNDTSSSDAARGDILNSYLKELNSLRHILFGVKTTNIGFLERWEGNVHNAYLVVHSNYGVIGLVVLLTGMIITLLLLRKQRSELFFVLLFFAIRCLTDKVFVGQLGDMIGWFFILFPILGRNTRLMNQRRFEKIHKG